MSRPWVILLILLGLALLGFEYVNHLYVENSGGSELAQLKAQVAKLEKDLEAQVKQNQRLLLELKAATEKNPRTGEVASGSSHRPDTPPPPQPRPER